MRHAPYRALWVVITGLSLSLFFAFSRPAATQDLPTATPAPHGMTEVTLEPTLHAQILATHAAQNAAWEAEFTSRTIFGFTVAYLMDGKAEGVDDIVSAPMFSDYFGAVAYGAWDDFVRANSESAFQMVFIHASMLDKVDATWFYEAYRRGVYIIGVNIRELVLAELVGDQCRRVGEKELLDYAPNVVTHFEYFPTLENPEHRERLDKAFLEDCTRFDTFTMDMGTIYMSTGTSRHSVYEVADLEFFANTLVAYTVSHGIKPERLLEFPEEPEDGQ